MKSVLIATIGTRDLMFKIASGEWYNIGDDRMRNAEIIGEQAEVISDLSLHDITYRNLTKYLLDSVNNYLDHIKPVIIGKLLLEKGNDIAKVYLIATDQKPEVKEREKDTIYAAELIKAWIVNQFDHITNDDVEIIPLGLDGTNPSNFEQMFQWWRQAWREKITIEAHQNIWVCLKGGVGQTSEASRISGLSLFGDRIEFFEFKQNSKANRIGIPSDYSGPFLGRNYLWDRTQQQALKLLERYDYAEVYDLLKPYFQDSYPKLPNLLQAGIYWNQGKFDKFLYEAKRSSLQISEQRGKKFWWMAYEQAYLALIRLQQQNTTEAMLHSYRSVEGVLYLWAKKSFPSDVKEVPNKFPIIKESILKTYPSLQDCFNYNNHKSTEVQLRSKVIRDLLEKAIPATATSDDFRNFWHSAQNMRNELSHRLGGITEEEVFRAWGKDKDIDDARQWEKRLLNCLNLISGQSFKRLSNASIFSQLHDRVIQIINNFEL